jgi:hypothetical protein
MTSTMSFPPPTAPSYVDPCIIYQWPKMVTLQGCMVRAGPSGTDRAKAVFGRNDDRRVSGGPVRAFRAARSGMRLVRTASRPHDPSLVGISVDPHHFPCWTRTDSVPIMPEIKGRIKYGTCRSGPYSCPQDALHVTIYGAR